MSELPPVSFGGLLRSLRTAAGLTQEELAEAARMSYRSVSDLERGVSRFPRRDTARLLADALGLSGDDRAGFEAAARGRPLAAGNMVPGLLPRGIAAATRTLPRDIASFTGREPEIESVLRAVAGTGAGGVIDICAIDGMAGIGKTALAVHAAHTLAGGFPDGQVFLPLHGHTPGQQPVDPADALGSLLRAAGIPAQSIPGGLEPRAWLWRDRLAGRRMLLVLDNAASSAQVTPLLPGDGECLVLVTSRRHLGDLPGAVTPVLLDVLTPEQATQMFTRLAPRAAGSPDEVTEVVRLAGFLPLAISLLARLFARHQSWTLADLAAETRASLLTLTAEHESVAAAFEVSYRHLDPARQRMFCLLGLHPGTSFDGYAAAALAGTSLNEAAALLDGLHGEGLLTETGHRRYGMHDLLRRYARDLAAGLPGGEQAMERLLDYYQHTAALAGDRMARQTRPGSVLGAPAGLPAAPDLDDGGQALAWARAERTSLLACLDHVTTTDQHARVIALTAALTGLLRRDGPWTDAITRHTAAAQAAQQLRDRPGQATALTHLGETHQLTGDYPAAAQVLEEALGIYRDIDDRHGQANALTHLGLARRLTGDYPAAAQLQEEALGIYRDLDERADQAGALIHLGTRHATMGDYPAAARLLEEALSIYRDVGDRHGQAKALTELGSARRLTGDYPAAARLLEEALEIACDLGDRRGEADALTYLGSVQRLMGEYPAAAQLLEEALRIFRDVGERVDQSRALIFLGNTRRLMGEYPAAARVLEEALGINRDLGFRGGQGNALTHLGVVRRLMGDYPAAARLLEEALRIFRDVGDRGSETEALNERGTLHRVSGDLAQAEGCHQQALELARATACLWDEAHALAGLSRCAIAAGHASQAGPLLRQALGIFQQIGAAETPGVLAELDALTSQAPQDKP
jgi:tetratricopeptide (TPR) repeat protein/transcriptional regulator with XRE-family HTH domain